MVKVMQLKKALYLWFPPLLWMGLIYFFSAQPDLSVGEGAVDFITRKPAHIAEYAILFLLLQRALRESFFLVGQQLYLASGVFTLLYGALDELHQMIVPTRAGRVYDLGFDLLGIFAGFLVIRFYRSRSE